MALARRCKATEVECDASVRTRERTVTVEASDPLMARVRTRNSTWRVPAGSRRLAE
jgi:hypothetical protein